MFSQEEEKNAEKKKIKNRIFETFLYCFIK